MHDCEVGDDGAIGLADGLGNLTNLMWLDLILEKMMLDNFIENEGFDILFDSLLEISENENCYVYCYVYCNLSNNFISIGEIE